MARITKFHPDGSITVADVPESSYHAKRGKVTPAAKASWGTPRDGMNKEHDPEIGNKLLGEALGD